jgi:hypothetical protein
LYLAKLSFENEGELKIFPDKWRLEEFVAARACPITNTKGCDLAKATNQAGTQLQGRDETTRRVTALV